MATKQELIEAGSTRWILNMRNLGRSRTWIIRRLQARNPGTTFQSAEAAYDWALKAESNVIHLTFGGPHVVPRAGDFPRSGTGCTWWRYYVLIEVTDVSTGDSHLIPHVINSPVSLSQQQVNTGSINSIDQGTNAALAYKFGGSQQQNLAVGNVHIQAAERACP